MIERESAGDAGDFAHAFASEVRAQLGRKNISGAELARRIGRSQAYVSTRLNGEKSFNLHEVDAIAVALSLDVMDLLAEALRQLPGQGK